MNPVNFPIYQMGCNPFCKEDAKSGGFYESEDFTEMTKQLDYLKEARGIGLFTARPGMGKTFCLHRFCDSLNTNLHTVLYMPFSTVSVPEFYRQLNDMLGLPPSGGRPKLFRQIQEHIWYLYREKRAPLLLAIDEAHHLSRQILNDLKILMNYEFDSVNPFTLILCGEPELNSTLCRPYFEALAQRITVHYNFQGLTDRELPDYIFHKLESAGAARSIISREVIAQLSSYAKGNPRIVDNVMTCALILGSQHSRPVIDQPIMTAAINAQALR